jgi:2-iminobutanoate/2-iminopropanoate deaminase
MSTSMKKEIATDEAPKATHILSQAVSSGGFLFVSGQVHVTPGGELVQGATGEKVRQIMQNIAAILGGAGAQLNDVVKATIYITDMAELKELNEAYATYFEKPFPAREAVCVKELPLGASIEISVIAAHP